MPNPDDGNPHVLSLAREKHSIGTIDGKPARKRLDRRRSRPSADSAPYTSAHARGGMAGMHPMHGDTGGLHPEHVAAIHQAVRHIMHNAPPEVAPIVHQAVAAHQLDNIPGGSGSDNWD